MFLILRAICCLQRGSKLTKVKQCTVRMLIQINLSSINCSEGLGTAALTSIYAGFVVGSLFLPTITIQRFGLKWTMEMDWDRFRLENNGMIYVDIKILFDKRFLSLGICFLLWQISGRNFTHLYQQDLYLVSVVRPCGQLMHNIQRCLPVNSGGFSNRCFELGLWLADALLVVSSLV